MIVKSEAKTDRALIEKAKTDLDAFGKLYDLYVDDVFRFVYFKVSNKEDAEDITARTFEKALKAIKNFKWKGYSFKTWLFVIAKNIVIDSFKAKRTNISIEQLSFDTKDEENYSVEDLTQMRLDREKLLKGLEKLADEYREILVMRYVEGLSISEVMQVSGKTNDSVKSLTKRAVQKLKQIIGE